MSYRLSFHKRALQEWFRLDDSVRSRLKVKLAQRLANPRVPSAKLSGQLTNCYKIRDDKSGYRLVYLVESEVVIVLAVAKRSNLDAYKKAGGRLP